MRVPDISDSSLRSWVENYIAEEVSRYKSARRSSQEFLDSIRRFTENDWSAWRALLPLREEAETRLFTRAEIDQAVAEAVRSSPPPDGWPEGYENPHRLDLEVKGLRALLGKAVPMAPQRSEVFSIPWQP